MLAHSRIRRVETLALLSLLTLPAAAQERSTEQTLATRFSHSINERFARKEGEVQDKFESPKETKQLTIGRYPLRSTVTPLPVLGKADLEVVKNLRHATLGSDTRVWIVLPNSGAATTQTEQAAPSAFFVKHDPIVRAERYGLAKEASGDKLSALKPKWDSLGALEPINRVFHNTHPRLDTFGSVYSELRPTSLVLNIPSLHSEILIASLETHETTFGLKQTSEPALEFYDNPHSAPEIRIIQNKNCTESSMAALNRVLDEIQGILESSYRAITGLVAKQAAEAALADGIISQSEILDRTRKYEFSNSPQGQELTLVQLSQMVETLAAFSQRISFGLDDDTALLFSKAVDDRVRESVIAQDTDATAYWKEIGTTFRRELARYRLQIARVKQSGRQDSATQKVKYPWGIFSFNIPLREVLAPLVCLKARLTE